MESCDRAVRGDSYKKRRLCHHEMLRVGFCFTGCNSTCLEDQSVHVNHLKGHDGPTKWSLYKTMKDCCKKDGKFFYQNFSEEAR